MNIPDEIAQAEKALADVPAIESKFKTMIVDFGPQLAAVAVAALVLGFLLGHFLAKA